MRSLNETLKINSKEHKMGTRSFISVEIQPGLWSNVLVKCDGQPGHVGQCLRTYYADQLNALALVSRGPFEGIRSKAENLPIFNVAAPTYGKTEWDTIWCITPEPYCSEEHHYIKSCDGEWVYSNTITEKTYPLASYVDGLIEVTDISYFKKDIELNPLPVE